MTDKVACRDCGALILAATAAANDGLCMPCKRGFRKNIEDGKRRAVERKQARDNPEPATLHWRWLVGQVARAPGGFAALSEENKSYFVVCLLEGEVYNGGFDQYFSNSSADYYEETRRALAELGAGECHRLLVAAKEVLFGAGAVPRTQAERQQRMARSTPARERKLDALDRLFGKESASLLELAARYAHKHNLYAGF
jgi:hypothetical protein